MTTKPNPRRDLTPTYSNVYSVFTLLENKLLLIIIFILYIYLTNVGISMLLKAIKNIAVISVKY